MPPVELTQPELERLSALIARRTRLRVASTGRDSLAALAVRRMSDLGIGFDEYFDELCQSAPNAGELERVTRELTVGESYFFRDPAQIDVLKNHIIPELCERRAAARELRVLSAGCATGEEPYTLAIVLSECVPKLPEWRITIIGLDINPDFLQRAVLGSYTDWSLRQMPDRIRDRYFVPLGHRHQLRPEIVERVRFHYANIAIDPLPAPALGVFGMDLVLCRNVLYYFEPDVRGRVTEALARSTALGGFLIFGHSDLVTPKVPLCKTQSFDNVVVFQRAERAQLSLPPPSPRVEPRAAAREVSFEQPIAPDTSALDLNRVLELANIGEIHEAIASVDGVIRDHPELAPAHLLHAFLLAECRADAAALDAFRRCLYLDPSLLLAHAGAAIAARRLGQQTLAKRHAACVRALVKDRPADSPVRGWEGMTAGRLTRLFGHVIAQAAL